MFLPVNSKNNLIAVTAVLFILCQSFSTGVASAAEGISRHYEGVLGTSMDVTVFGADEDEVDAALKLTLEQLSVLDISLSTYRKDSALSTLNRDKSGAGLPGSLLDVLELCQQWWITTEQRFSCRMGQINVLWEQAEADQELPDRIEVRAMARKILDDEFTVDVANSAVSIGGSIDLDPSGLAKGYVIDQLIRQLTDSLPGAEAIKLDIGGDAIYSGSPPNQDGWQVAVADPVNVADNAGYLSTLRLQDKAVAASGHTSRYRTVGRREYSHILQSRDGWPVQHGVSAIVVADDAVTADVVATTLTLYTASDGIAWVDAMPDVEALVVTSDGRQSSSAGWSTFIADSAISKQESSVVLSLDFEIPDIPVAEYHSPYVAIWITDINNKAVKNLLLLGETERWAREVTRWWRRVGRRNPELLNGVARPTRPPGHYDLTWNGIDDFGQIVPDGDYLIHFEASREQGGASYLRLPITLGGEFMVEEVAADEELGHIHLEVNVR